MIWIRKHPVLSIMAGGLLLTVAIVAIWNGSLKSANQKRLDAITARGEPVTLTELDRFYKPVPDASNAALMWLNARALLPEDVSALANKIRMKRGGRIDPEQLTPVIDILATNKEALASLYRAAALPQSRYPISLNQMPFTNWGHLSAVRGAANVLRGEAAVAIEQTNNALAAEAITAVFAAARSLAHEPVVISQLVRFAIDAIGVQALEYALNAIDFKKTELQTIQSALASADDPDSVARGLIGERVFFISALSDPGGYIAGARGIPAGGFEEIVSEVFVLPLTQATGFWKRDLRFGIDALTTNIAFARLPDPQRFHSTTNSTAISMRAKRGYYIMTYLFLPAMDKFVTRDANHRAQARTALVAVAIERYRLAHDGNLPDHLSSLVPKYIDKLPIDPFDGQPVRSKKTDNGYVVWCIGLDEKDDGGAEKVPKAPKGAPEDVTFIVERQHTN